MIGADTEQLVDLIKHFPVLPGNGNNWLAVPRMRQSVDQRGHLDGFGPGSVDEQYLAHADFPSDWYALLKSQGLQRLWFENCLWLPRRGRISIPVRAGSG